MRVAIVGGAGGVGTSVAYNLLLTRRPWELVLVDPRERILLSHLLDLEQVLEQSPGGSIRAGSAADLAGADVLVLTAAVPLAVAPRLSYLRGNARIADEVADALPAGWPGLLLVVTNPVDALVTRLQRRTGLDRRRVLGYTLNDGLRLATGVGRALGVAPGRVGAWVVGEHGEGIVPLFDRIEVDGQPRRLDPEAARAAGDYLRTWYDRHVALDSGRSSTWTSGLGIARVLAALADGGGGPWPASVVLAGEYGIDGVAVTVPVELSRGGVERIHEWRLAAAELAALRAAAELVREAVARADAP